MNKFTGNKQPRRKRKGGTHKVGDLVAGFTRGKLVRGMQRGRALVAWSEIIGPTLARTTHAISLRDGIMEIETQDAMMATTLTMQRGMFLDKLREVLGEDAPRELRFHSGSIKPEDAVLQEKPMLSAFHEQEVLQEATRLSQSNTNLPTERPAELQTQIKKMAETIARVRRTRQLQGYKPCPVCGTLCDNNQAPCLSCRVLMRDVRVRELSLRLARQPELALNEPQTLADTLFPEATEHSLTCAKFLALEYLTAKLNELALETVRTAHRPEEEAELRRYLNTNAQAYLALLLGQNTSNRKDWQHLPANVRNVLESGL